ncbi:hypothetical protein K8Q94_02025 [Candidatus Nomurabacteria bacterium]|nr:hypothetical protein [Candidatus Nomurabacteria bacterium]
MVNNCESFSFKDWATIVISILALIIASRPYWPIKPEINGRIISLTGSPSISYTHTDINLENKTINGFGYTLQVSLTVLKKAINIKDFDVFVKYPGDEKYYSAKAYKSDDVEYKFNNGKKNILRIPSDKDLLFITYLKQDKANSYYVSFVVEKEKSTDFKLVLNFEEIKFVFYDYNGKSYSVLFYKKDMDASKLYFDENSWKVE